MLQGTPVIFPLIVTHCQSRSLIAEMCIRDRVEEVLFEQERKKNVYEGYTRNYTPVLAVSSRPLHGLLLPVRLTGVLESACTGEIVQN